MPLALRHAQPQPADMIPPENHHSNPPGIGQYCFEPCLSRIVHTSGRDDSTRSFEQSKCIIPTASQLPTYGLSLAIDPGSFAVSDPPSESSCCPPLTWHTAQER